MAMSMMPLLIHSEVVSAEVRRALRTAQAAPPDLRPSELETAARMLHRETGLSCTDVRDLFGLGPKTEC